MKKLLLMAVAVLSVFFSVNAQTPSVSIVVDSVSATTVSASFTKNANCTSYYFMIAEEEVMESFMEMFDCGAEPLVASWGIETFSDTSYTWRDMAPSTQYVIYVVALSSSNDSVLSTISTVTSSIGGSGESIISIEVSEITQSSARVICTPNDQTAVFFDQLIEKSLVDEIGMDSAAAIVQGGYYPMYDVDDWVWAGLNPGTEIYAFAQGQNSLGEWGPLAMQLFTTLGSSEGIALVQKARLSVYPNPATDKAVVSLSGLSVETIQLFDLAGRQLLNIPVASGSGEVALDLHSLQAGTYILRASSKGNIGYTETLVIR